jgi:tRNA-dihydrouridine synthase
MNMEHIRQKLAACYGVGESSDEVCKCIEKTRVGIVAMWRGWWNNPDIAREGNQADSAEESDRDESWPSVCNTPSDRK